MKRNGSLALTLLPAFTLSGCAGQHAAEQSARTIQNSIGLYEQRIDLLIQKQDDYYTARLAEYQRARTQLFESGLDENRYSASMQFADELAADPAAVRRSKLVKFLQQNEAQEFALRTSQDDKQHDAETAFTADLATLQSQRQLASDVKSDLAKLAKKSNIQEQVSGLKDYGQEVETDLQKASQGSSGSK
jgi:hypothetical protein